MKGLIIFLIGSGISAMGLGFMLNSMFMISQGKIISETYGSTQLGLSLLIIGIVTFGVGLHFWWPYVSRKVRKILGSIAGGVLVSVISIIYLNFLYGACFFPGCTTQIEILEFGAPDEVNWMEKPTAYLVIKNTGGDVAKDCRVFFDFTSRAGGAFSEYFSLEPKEQTEISVKGEEGAQIVNTDGYIPGVTKYCVDEESYQGSSRASVRCFNADSGQVSKSLQILCPDK